MKQFYIAHSDLLRSTRFSDAFPHPTVNLFHPVGGAHWVSLEDGWNLVAASVDHSEFSEVEWGSHPNVAVLPHPVFEPTMKLSELLDSKQHRFTPAHQKALAAIGVTGDHTVWDVHRIARKLHPLCRLRNVE
jgi:hypothetical protein